MPNFAIERFDYTLLASDNHSDIISSGKAILF